MLKRTQSESDDIGLIGGVDWTFTILQQQSA